MPTFQETIFVDKDIKLTVTADSTSSGYVTEVTPGEVNNELFTVLTSNAVVITSSLNAKTYLIVSTLGKLTTSLTQGVGGGLAALVDDTAPQLGGGLDLNGNNLFDANGNIILGFDPVASATNYVEISNGVDIVGDSVIIGINSQTINTRLDLVSHGNASLVRMYNHSNGGMYGFKSNESTAGTTMIIRTNHTANRTLFIPDADDTLIGKATTDTLTNKTIDTATNTITVNETDLSTSVGATGTVLTSNGAGVAPTYQTVGNWKYVETKTASNSSELAFTDLTAGTYKLDISNLVPDTDAQTLQMQVSNDNGVSYVTANYQNTGFNIRPIGTNTGFVTDFTHFAVSIFGIGTDAGEFGLTGEIILRVMNEANPMRYSSNLQFTDSITGGFTIEIGQGISADNNNTGSTTNVNAARLFVGSGLLASGIVHW